MKLRTGRRVGRTIYAQLGQEPSDDDQLVGVMDTAALAHLVVDAVNDGREGSEDALSFVLERRNATRATWLPVREWVECKQGNDMSEFKIDDRVTIHPVGRAAEADPAKIGQIVSVSPEARYPFMVQFADGTRDLFLAAELSHAEERDCANGDPWEDPATGMIIGG